MRKSKEFKRMRKLAGLQFKRGESAEAYKQWADAAKGYKERLDKKRSKKTGAAATEAS